MVDTQIIDPEAYINDPSMATGILVDYLKEGNLILAIGTGASSGMGLPRWKTLVEKCLLKTNEKYNTSFSTNLPDSIENKQLCSYMDQVEKTISGNVGRGENIDYRDLVHECLYENVHYDTILRKDLLISFGALLMGSKRGSIKTVFNFNFDDVLDWYMLLHGFDTQIITTYPTLLRDADVTIYHPHGFLPKKLDRSSSSDFLILSQYSYDEKMGDIKEPWLDILKMSLKNKVFIFVGLSGEDQTFGPTLVDVQKVIGDQRYTGFWLFGPNRQEDQINYLKERNIIPLCFESFDEYPKFLLNICQEALL